MKGYTASVILQPQNATRSGPILSVNPCVLKGPFWALFGDVSTLDTNFGTLWDGASALLLQLLPSLAKKKSQSQNSAGMHLSVTHRLLSILNLTVGQHHGHAQFQVYRVILPEYISNIPAYQSAWFIMILHVSMKTCWEAIHLTEPLSLKFVVQLILTDLNNIKEWLTDHQAVFEGFTSDSVFGYLRIS